MINVCVPSGSPIVSHLIIEVQVSNGNITSMTLHWVRCFKILSIWMLGLLECFVHLFVCFCGRLFILAGGSQVLLE